MSNNSKLETLRRIEGYASVISMLETATYDGVCPGICVNKDCDYTTSVEPDQGAGHCENCNTKTVKSALMLAGII